MAKVDKKVDKKEDGEHFSAKEVEMMDATTAAEVRGFAVTTQSTFTDSVLSPI